MGPAVAEMEFEERPNEPFVFFAADKTDPGYQSLLQVLAEREREIEFSKAESIQNGIVLRMERLVDMFSLTAFEKDILLLCLLPELDLKYERLFGYIQDDVTRKRPTVALSLDILCSSLQDKLLKLNTLKQKVKKEMTINEAAYGYIKG